MEIEQLTMPKKKAEEELYEKLKDSLRTIYYESESLTPEIMNALNLVLWKAEQYDRLR